MPGRERDLSKSAVEGLMALRAALVEEIAQRKEKLASIEAAIALVEGGKAALPQGKPGAAKYSNLPPQQAVEALLRDNPNSTFRVAELAEELKRNGFVPRAKSFLSQVNVCLNRLAEREVAERTSKDGRTAFRLARRRP